MTIDFEPSFQYTFHDLLQILNLNRAEYILAERIIPDYMSGHFSTLKLTISSYCKSETDSQLEEVLSKNLKQTLKNIKEEYQDHKLIIDYYIEKITSFLSRAETIKKRILNKNYTELKTILHLEYLGEEYIEPPITGLIFQKPKETKNDIEKVYPLLIPYIEVVTRNLDKLKNGLKHLKTIYQIRQSEKISISKINTSAKELLSLIERGELEEFFIKIKELPELNNHTEIITISSRYSHNEQRRRRGILSREDYEVNYNNIVREIIAFLQEN
jgi:hypothetical protein